MLFAKSIPPRARRAYIYDSWAAILVGIYTGSIFPFFAIVAREKLHADGVLISAMMAAPFVGNLFALFWANAMEGRCKMRFALWSWITGRGILFLMLFAVTPLRFAIVFFIAQFLVTAASPAYAHILKDIYPDGQRGRIMGFVRVLLALTQIVTTFVAGWLLKIGHGGHIFTAGSYQWVFPMGALFGIASALAFGRIRTSKPQAIDKADRPKFSVFMRSTFAILKNDQGFRWFSLSVFTYGFGSILVMPIYPIFQVDRLHINTGEAAILANITAIVWMLSFLYWGRYVDTRSPLKATVVNVSLAMLCPLNYFIASMLPNPTVWMLLPSAVLFGVTNAGIELAYFNAVLKFANEENTAHYQALFACMLGIRGSIAPFIGGVLCDQFTGHNIDMRIIFVIATVIMLVGAWMQLVGLKASRKTQKA